MIQVFRLWWNFYYCVPDFDIQYIKWISKKELKQKGEL